MINNFKGIYDAAMIIEPFEGIITFEDILKYCENLFNEE